MQDLVSVATARISTVKEHTKVLHDGQPASVTEEGVMAPDNWVTLLVSIIKVKAGYVVIGLVNGILDAFTSLAPDEIAKFRRDNPVPVLRPAHVETKWNCAFKDLDVRLPLSSKRCKRMIRTLRTLLASEDDTVMLPNFALGASTVPPGAGMLPSGAARHAVADSVLYLPAPADVDLPVPSSSSATVPSGVGGVASANPFTVLQLYTPSITTDNLLLMLASLTADSTPTLNLNQRLLLFHPAPTVHVPPHIWEHPLGGGPPSATFSNPSTEVDSLLKLLVSPDPRTPAQDAVVEAKMAKLTVAELKTLLGRFEELLRTDIIPSLRGDLVDVLFNLPTDPPPAELLPVAAGGGSGAGAGGDDELARLRTEVHDMKQRLGAGEERANRHRWDLNRILTLLDGESMLAGTSAAVLKRLADLAHGSGAHLSPDDDGRTDVADNPEEPPVELNAEQRARYDRLRSLLRRDVADLAGAHAPHTLLASRMGTPSSTPAVGAGPLPAAKPSAASSLKPPPEPTLVAGSRNISDFFQRYELFFTIANVPDDQRVHRAALSIKSPAVTSQWFAFVDNLGRPPTWQDFKEQVTIYTRGHAAQAKAADDLAACVQGNSSVDAYAAKYTKLTTDAGYPLTDARVVKGFLQGLRDNNFRTVLTGLAPNRQAWPNLTDLVSAASQLAVMSTAAQPRHNNPPPRRHSANFARSSGGGRAGRGGKTKHYTKRSAPSAPGTIERTAERVAKREAHSVANQHLQKRFGNGGEGGNRGPRRDDRDGGRRRDDRQPTKYFRRDDSPSGAGGFSDPVGSFRSLKHH
jgi:hypothetical protein